MGWEKKKEQNYFRSGENTLQRKIQGSLSASHTKGRQDKFIKMQKYAYRIKHEIEENFCVETPSF